MRSGTPKVAIGGQPVSVLKASEREVLIAPMAHQFAGTLTIETAPDARADAAFDLQPALAKPVNGAASSSAEGPAPGEGGTS